MASAAHLFAVLRALFFFILVFMAVQACTPPRNVIHSGKVTPKGQVKVGADVTGNFTSHFARSLYKNVEAIVEPLVNKDSLQLDEQILNLNRTALAYAIDPFGAGYGFYARYGFTKGLDMGYRLASGTHVFDAMYQFAGSKGTIDEPEEGMLHGSIGFQYGFKNYSLPGWSDLKLAQKILDFNLKRKDILVPLIFSVGIGPEETYGAVSFGLAYSHTFLDYGFGNSRIYDTLNSVSPEIVASIHDKKHFPAWGAFFNLKLGYSFIYIIPACALYYQNYGTYNLIDGSTASFKGVSLTPSLGLQLNLMEIENLMKKNKKPKPQL